MEKNFIVGLKLKPQRKKSGKLIWIILLIFIGVLGTYMIFNQSGGELVSPLSKTQATNPANPLKTVVEDILAGTKGSYGIVIKNLKTGESYYANEHQSFETGSLYKLWVMATVYKQIQEGKLTKDQVLSKSVASLNRIFDIDPDLAEFSEGTVTFTVYNALHQMITISHNYAALLLTEKIKLSSVAAFLTANGFTDSTVGTNGDVPKSTASDIALFYEKLYKGELAEAQYTNEMIELLKKQQFNDGLPKYLPADLGIAHKTGEIGWFKHDAGIVYRYDENYIIVILSESDSPLGAKERIALISKAVYDYFSTSQNNTGKK